MLTHVKLTYRCSSSPAPTARQGRDNAATSNRSMARPLGVCKMVRKHGHGGWHGYGRHVGGYSRWAGIGGGRVWERVGGGRVRLDGGMGGFGGCIGSGRVVGGLVQGRFRWGKGMGGFREGACG
jgi:hypothetical protein